MLYFFHKLNLVFHMMLCCDVQILKVHFFLFLQATAPFLQLGGVVALTLISWLVFQSFHRAKATGQWCPYIKTEILTRNQNLHKI